MILLIILTFSFVGGWLSRMCGGAPPKMPWGLDQWLYALPYLLISLPAALTLATVLSVKKENRKYFWAIVWAIALLPYAGAFIGKRTGHGGGMDLATNNKEPDDGREPEKLEYLILWLHGKIPQYWYDALLLAITGLAVTLIAGVMMSFINPLWGAVLALSGLTKAPAYMIGHLIYPNQRGRGIPYLDHATAIGEFLTGFFGYGILAITFIAVFMGGF